MLPDCAFARVPRYMGLRVHRRVVDNTRFLLRSGMPSQNISFLCASVSDLCHQIHRRYQAAGFPSFIVTSSAWKLIRVARTHLVRLQSSGTFPEPSIIPIQICVLHILNQSRLVNIVCCTLNFGIVQTSKKPRFGAVNFPRVLFIFHHYICNIFCREF